MQKIQFLTIFLMLTILLGACGPTRNTSLQVHDAWARPGLSTGNSAVYFVIDNLGADDTLLSVSSDVAQAAEMHKTKMEGDNMQMLPQQEVSIAAGTTDFEPGGLHVMLIDLDHDLNPGDRFNITLTFKTAGEKTLTAIVKEP